MAAHGVLRMYKPGGLLGEELDVANEGPREGEREEEGRMGCRMRPQVSASR